MKHWVRAVVAIAGVAALIAGCGKGSISESHGDPTTASAGQPVAAAEVDSLVIPMNQIPGILSDDLHNQAVVKQPSQPGDTCPAAYTGVGDPTPIAFRKASYSGFSNVYVTQTIGVYPSSADASTAFRQLTDKLGTCRATVDSATPTSATWHTQGFSPVKGEDETYPAVERVVQNVVYLVTAGHFGNSEQIAAATADQIAAKINNAA